MRNMSFSMTVDRIKDGSKTVTRRIGWWFLKPGDQLQAVEKCQGLKKGEKVKKIRLIEVVEVNGEPLDRLLTSVGNFSYSSAEMEREGFPEMAPAEFVERFCKYNKCAENIIVNRIEFKYI